MKNPDRLSFILVGVQLRQRLGKDLPQFYFGGVRFGRPFSFHGARWMERHLPFSMRRARILITIHFVNSMRQSRVNVKALEDYANMVIFGQKKIRLRLGAKSYRFEQRLIMIY